MRSSTFNPQRPFRRGFTLIEILIVVIILGILSSIVIPQFSNATNESREATLRDCLRYLRTQITIFRAQHRDVCPGYPNGDTAATPDAATFVQQMTLCSDENCNLNASPTSVFKFGPYLSSMPMDPLSTSAGVWVVTGATMPAPDQSQPYGWIYNPQTQTIIANLSGTDAGGTPYSSY
jgi:prepilin-type N-terminal cleavage/methylation domain-containing protein